MIALDHPPDDAYLAHRATRGAYEGDRTRRHYDLVDAEAIVRRFERDYGVRLRHEPCKLRRNQMHHIEFAVSLEPQRQAVLVRYCDGYLPVDMCREFPNATARQIGEQLSDIARKAGLSSRHHLVTLAVYFGIVTPTMMLEQGEYS